MTKNLMKYLFAGLLLAMLTMTSCGDDDINTTDNKVSFDLTERNSSGVSGDIEFVELTDGKVQIEISLSGTSDGNTHPAHIHMNSAAVGGDILISIDPVDGATGSSVTIVDRFDDGSSFTFSMIDALDAYVNVHLSADDLATVVAQGDIGSNLFTGEEIRYNLEERAVEGIRGSVTFKERKNGAAVAIIDLDGTPNGGMHPAHIHMNSAAEGGGILVSLTPVDGTTGMSTTEIRRTDDGAAYNYDDLLTSNAYVNVHLSMEELSTIVAQGDIGLNALTGSTTTYLLDAVDVDGIDGEVRFDERRDGSVLATIFLSGTPDGGMHPAHIHENDKDTGGPIAISFNPVDGTSGISRTSIRTDDKGDAVNFQQMINYDGYVNVHLSAEELSTIVAQGNIGINN